MNTIKSWFEAIYTGHGPWTTAAIVLLTVVVLMGVLWFAATMLGVDVGGTINGWLT